MVFRFHDYAETLDVSAADLYTALLADAENLPPNWNLQGRQVDAWKQYSELQLTYVGNGHPNDYF